MDLFKLHNGKRDPVMGARSNVQIDHWICRGVFAYPQPHGTWSVTGINGYSFCGDGNVCVFLYETGKGPNFFHGSSSGTSESDLANQKNGLSFHGRGSCYCHHHGCCDGSFRLGMHKIGWLGFAGVVCNLNWEKGCERRTE